MAGDISYTPHGHGNLTNRIPGALGLRRDECREHGINVSLGYLTHVYFAQRQRI